MKLGFTAQARRGKAAVAVAMILAALPNVAMPRPAHAWSASGHMMVASIAYDRLNPHAKAEVDRLLKMPDVAGIAKIGDDPRENFIRISTWADSLRNQDDYRYTGPEHYIDYPIAGDDSGTPLPALATDNVVVALQKCITVLKDPAAKDTDKAFQLRLLIHFVGDEHQPLHGASRVTKDHPKGDKGGNDFHVGSANGGGGRRPQNLHSLWDGGVGAFPTGARTGRFNTGNGAGIVAPAVPPADGNAPPAGGGGSFRAFPQPSLTEIGTAATKAISANPETSSDWHTGTGFPYSFADWAGESKALAQSAAYADLPENSVPTKEYIERGQKIALQRVAWAGYRLAALLNDLYPANSPSASAPKL